MSNYIELLDQKHNKSLINIDKLKSSLLLGNDEQKKLLMHFYKKISQIYKEIWKDEVSLQSAASCIRYLFEALVKTEKMKKDSFFLEKFKLSYLVTHKQQLNSLLNQLEKDVKLLVKYENKLLSLKPKTFEGISSGDDVLEIFEYNNSIEDKVYEELDNEFSYFLDRVSLDTVGITKDKFIVDRKKNLLERIKEIDGEIKEISKNNYNKKEFNRKQPSGLESFLKKKSSSIKEDSNEVGLIEEYEFLYTYTSSLIHCTSYSIHSNPDIEETELYYMKNTSIKYVNRISSNLLDVAEIPKDILVL